LDREVVERGRHRRSVPSPPPARHTAA
jgi:hypothetical protein